MQGLIGWSVPYTLASLACAEARLGDLEGAAAHLREAEPGCQPLADPAAGDRGLLLTGEALVALGRGRPQEAARLLAAAEATHQRIGLSRCRRAPRAGAGRRGRPAGALDPAALAAARAAGAGLGPGGGPAGPGCQRLIQGRP